MANIAGSTNSTQISIDNLSHSTAMFRTMSRKMYPRNMDEVFAWARELWFHHGIYTSAIQKAVRYFMTEIEIEGENDISYQTKKKYKDILERNFDIMEDLAILGEDYIAFGNSFTTIHVPFIRQLVCPICGFTAPLKEMFDDYVKWTDSEFTGTCPSSQCQYKGKFIIRDIRKPEETLTPIITRWPPQHVFIKAHPTTGTKEYYIDLTKFKELYEGVVKGDLLFLDETPLELIYAIRDKKIFKFNRDELYHMSNSTVAYTNAQMKGWGLPKFMAEFETVILINMLDKFNESIISDYLIPFRVVSPPSTGNQAAFGASDPMLKVGTSNFVGNAKRMLDRHRKNPTDWNFFPFPVQYQVLGGEAKDLAPVELMEHFEGRLLNAMGIPQEFYAGSVNNSAGPIIGFRMFERTWQHFAKELDNWLTWFVQKIGELYNWETVSAHIIPVTLYEDPEVRGTKLELAAAKEISQTTALRSLGIDRDYERRRIMEEEMEDEEMYADRDSKVQTAQAGLDATMTLSPGEDVLQQEQMMAEQQAMMQQQQGGQPPMPMGAPQAGGMPGMAAPAEGTTNPATLDELLYQAEDIANQLLYMDPYTRRSQLLSIKRENEALHAQVKSKLATLEQQASQMGLNMVRQGQLPMQ